MAKKEKEVKEIKFKIIILDAVIAIGIVAILFAGVGYLVEKLKATSAATSYKEVAKEAVPESRETINFNIVHSAGSTATSWLYVPGTKIDYPLVQGPNNDLYLDTDAYGNKSEAGAIFINFANSSDMSDAKTVIFGHNMQDGSMFTDLHKYSDEEYGKVHQDAYIYMEGGQVKHYRLRYYLFTEPLNPTIYVVSKADVALDEAQKIKNDAEIVYNEAAGGNLICLSTCTMHKYRTVVVFEYVDDKLPIMGSAGYEDYENGKKADISTGESSDRSVLDASGDDN